MQHVIGPLSRWLHTLTAECFLLRDKGTDAGKSFTVCVEKGNTVRPHLLESSRVFLLGPGVKRDDRQEKWLQQSTSKRILGLDRSAVPARTRTTTNKTAEKKLLEMPNVAVFSEISMNSTEVTQPTGVFLMSA